MMKIKKDSRILIVGHDDIIEKSLFDYFKTNGFSDVTSSSDIALNTTVQSSVYHFFSENKPEYVFLSSVASGGIAANQKNPAEFIYSNLESQNNIVYSANKFGATKLLFIGSSCVYPKTCSQPMKENMIGTGPMEKTSEPYSTAKLAGIRLCQGYKKQYGFNAVSMIPSTVYGPGTEEDMESSHVIGALISKFAEAVANCKDKVSVWGTGNPRREFLYKDDFVQACLLLMNKYDGDVVINAGCGYDVTIRELAEIICTISGFKGEIVFEDTKIDGVMQKLLDNQKISDMGWVESVGLQKGIEETYKAYLDKLKSKIGA